MRLITRVYGTVIAPRAHMHRALTTVSVQLNVHYMQCKQYTYSQRNTVGGQARPKYTLHNTSIENVARVLCRATCAPFIDQKLQDKREKNNISQKESLLLNFCTFKTKALKYLTFGV